jgi:hypothetical protein
VAGPVQALAAERALVQAVPEQALVALAPIPA